MDSEVGGIILGLILIGLSALIGWEMAQSDRITKLEQLNGISNIEEQAR